MQRPPFWHREDTSVPGERDKQRSIKLSGWKGAQAPDTEQRGLWGPLTSLGRWVPEGSVSPDMEEIETSSSTLAALITLRDSEGYQSVNSAPSNVLTATPISHS